MRQARNWTDATGALTAAVAGFLSVSCAGPLDASPVSVCANTDVLTFVANRYSDASAHAELIPSTAAQWPTAVTDTVLCAVYQRRAIYDNAKYGGLPEIRFEPRFFRVKTLAQGFEVDFIP